MAKAVSAGAFFALRIAGFSDKIVQEERKGEEIMFLTGTKKMLGDRIFLQKAVRIALPVAMQGMLNTIVNLVDTMMIGTLGETTIAAVGLAIRCFFVFSLLVFGIVSGSGVLAASTGAIMM